MTNVQKTYKDKLIFLGYSDIARLTVVFPEGCQDLDLQEDGDYRAWLIRDEEVEVPEHYKKVLEGTHWLKVYDDEDRVAYIHAKTIEIYRAGMRGILIRAID